MKKIIFTVLSAGCVVTSFSSVMAQEDKPREKALQPTHLEGNEFKEFLTLVIPKETVFREHYEELRVAVGKVIAALEEEKTLDSGLQGETIRIIKKARKSLKEFRGAVTSF